jgi:hypothetical protein
MRKIICLPKKKNSGSGSYGNYFIINKKNKIGLKISHFPQIFNKTIIESCAKEIRTKGKFNSNDLIMSIIKEAAFMYLIQNCNMIPKIKELIWVKKNGIQNTKCYYLGILMEHIDGKLAVDYEYFKQKQIVKEAVDNFEKKTYGVHLDDWNFENVIVDKKGKIFRIDFGSDFFTIASERKKEFWNIVREIFEEITKNFPEELDFSLSM